MNFIYANIHENYLLAMIYDYFLLNFMKNNYFIVQWKQLVKNKSLNINVATAAILSRGMYNLYTLCGISYL